MQPVTPIIPGFELPVTVYAKDQPKYRQFPVFKDADGTTVSRWKLTFWERLKVLVGGNIYLTLLTFNQPLQPVKLSVECPIDYGFNSN
jgi:hypothetical protein